MVRAPRLASALSAPAGAMRTYAYVYPIARAGPD